MDSRSAKALRSPAVDRSPIVCWICPSSNSQTVSHRWLELDLNDGTDRLHRCKVLFGAVMLRSSRWRDVLLTEVRPVRSTIRSSAVRRILLVAVICLAFGLGFPLTPSGSAATSPAPSTFHLWAPGITLSSVSCTSIGGCTAVGQRGDAGAGVPFHVTETAGVWGKATAFVAPTGSSLTDAGSDVLLGISCMSAGDCTAVGYNIGPPDQPVYAVEAAGTWGAVTQLSNPPVVANRSSQ
jgi:hypothetical protein